MDTSLVATMDDTTRNNIMECGFTELLRSLNPYIDELTYLPKFFLFDQLPVELRNRVYEYYFLEDQKSVACREWPSMVFNDRLMLKIKFRRARAPFLPNLCLKSKTFRDEGNSTLLGLACIEFRDCRPLEFTLERIKRPSLYLANTVSKTVLNHPKEVFLSIPLSDEEMSLSEGEEALPEEDYRRPAEILNKLQLSILPLFPRLHELSLILSIPLRYRNIDLDPDHPNFTELVSIENHLKIFGLDAILGMAHLCRVTVTTESAYWAQYKMFVPNGDTPWDEDTKRFQATVELCKQIKAGFRAQSRQVVVEARLQYDKSQYQKEFVS